MANLLRHARSDHGPLKDNAAHAFAASHALCHYDSGTIYSFIPKNACTTMRFTLAVANGCIRGEEDFAWIHRNNRTFVADTRELATARQSFVILRCPYSRLASFFLDKIVREEQPAHQLLRLIPDAPAIGQMTFRQVAKAMLGPDVRNTNPHWREQRDFLVYESYGAYLRMEAFGEAVQEIRRLTGLDVLDARRLSRHGLESFSSVEGEGFCDLPAAEIARMMAAGEAPARRAMFDDSVVADVAAAYAGDVALYRSLFGDRDLMFS